MFKKIYNYTPSVSVSDEGMSALMSWLLPSSANTLTEISFLYNTTFTRTPIQLGSFTNISSYIGIQMNEANMTISAGSIVSNPGIQVSFGGANVVEVEEGAFLGKCDNVTFIIQFKIRIIRTQQPISCIAILTGNFARSYFTLGGNLFGRFEAGVFKTILEQMGSIDIRGSNYTPIL